jgi:hypothetical protein
MSLYLLRCAPKQHVVWVQTLACSNDELLTHPKSDTTNGDVAYRGHLAQIGLWI